MDNLYAPPAAAVAETAVAPAIDEFYVVSPRKLALLLVGTLGLYQMYWMYRHWAQFRRRRKASMWPIARAIFPIFFAHSLKDEINARLRVIGGTPLSSSIATLYVIVALVGNILDRLAFRDVGSPYTDLAGYAMLLPLGHAMVVIQRAANAACGDANASSNRRLTWANWLWLIAGGLLWLLALAGLLLPTNAAA